MRLQYVRAPLDVLIERRKDLLTAEEMTTYAAIFEAPGDDELATYDPPLSPATGT